MLLGLEYIHENKVIHRDIKPENLVCDENGYIRITDFGIAKNYHKVNKTETSGTPGYMAPEVLCSQNHSYPVDYFAIGVICYEFMLGKRPYHGKGRKEVKQDVISHQVKVVKEEIPTGWSYEAADFINSLIQRKAKKRLFAGLEVNPFRIFWRLPPASFSRLPDITCIPNRKKASPPQSCNIE